MQFNLYNYLVRYKNLQYERLYMKSVIADELLYTQFNLYNYLVG